MLIDFRDGDAHTGSDVHIEPSGYVFGYQPILFPECLSKENLPHGMVSRKYLDGGEKQGS